jgi:hypothetical protein
MVSNYWLQKYKKVFNSCKIVFIFLYDKMKIPKPKEALSHL